MKEYVLNITITIFLLSILTIIIPGGQVKKNIKSIFALIITIVIIQPIFNLKDTEIKFDYIFNMENFTIQSEYLDYINKKAVDEYEKNCNKILENNGVYGARIDIEYTFDINNVLIIEKILINLKNSVIKSDKVHIDIIEGIKNDIKSYFSVDKEQVVVYGW